MRSFRTVFGFEFRQTLRSKSFIILSVMMLLTLIGGAVAGIVFFGADSGLFSFDPTVVIPEDMLIPITPDQSGNMAIYTVVYDNGNVDDEYIKRLGERLPSVDFVRCELDEDTIDSAIADGADGCIIFTSPLSFDYYRKSSIHDSFLASLISDAMTRLYREDEFALQGVSPSDSSQILNSAAWHTDHMVGGYGMGKFILNTIITVFLFVLITLYGQMVAMRVTSEKSSRTVEVLATSVSPFALLCGKVAGIGAAALAQVGVFAALAVLLGGISSERSAELAAVLGGLDISAADVLFLLAYFLLGFTLISLLYGGMGAMVSQQEDLSGLASLPMALLMGGYFIAIFSTSFGKPNLLLRIASFVPFWSPVVMFSRMSLEPVSMAEIFLSLLLLAGTVVLTAVAAARLYRRGMLRYGKAPKLREIWAMIKK